MLSEVSGNLWEGVNAGVSSCFRSKGKAGKMQHSMLEWGGGERFSVSQSVFHGAPIQRAAHVSLVPKGSVCRRVWEATGGTKRVWLTAGLLTALKMPCPETSTWWGQDNPSPLCRSFRPGRGTSVQNLNSFKLTNCA